MMVGNSQLKRLQPEKLSNRHHTVDIRAFSGMKIQQAASKLGKCDSNIIIVHAGTNNMQGWHQEFSDGGLILPTRGLKYGF